MPNWADIFGIGPTFFELGRHFLNWADVPPTGTIIIIILPVGGMSTQHIQSRNLEKSIFLIVILTPRNNFFDFFSKTKYVYNFLCILYNFQTLRLCSYSFLILRVCFASFSDFKIKLWPIFVDFCDIVVDFSGFFVIF